MKKLIFGICAFAAITATSCSKDKEDKPNPGGGSATIQGNWAVDKIVTIELGVDPATYEGTAEDYYKFGADGNVDVKVGDYTASVSYEMIDASHVSIDGDIEEIKQLTDHKLVLHSPSTDEVPEGMTFTLTR